MPLIDLGYTRPAAGWVLVSVSATAALALSSASGHPLAPWLPDVAGLLYGLVGVDVVLCGLRWCRCW
jgi:hypothetical protein